MAGLRVHENREIVSLNGMLLSLESRDAVGASRWRMLPSSLPAKLHRLCEGAGRVTACILSASVISAAADSVRPVVRLDLGPAGSAVEEGFERLPASLSYRAERGYGWASEGQVEFDVPRPDVNPEWLGPAGQLVPQDYVAYKEYSALTRDGVASSEDLRLRIDLPDGRYSVRLVLGRLDRAVCSMQVSLNGERVATDVNARHFARRGLPDMLYGFPRRIRRDVDVRDGVLEIRIHGDDSGFHQRFLREFQRPAPVSYLAGVPTRNGKPPRPDPSAWGRVDPRTGRPGGNVWVYEDIGCPFTENALASVEIHPFERPLLEWSDGRLSALSDDATLHAGVEHFNGGRYANAEEAFRSVNDGYGRALGLLWIVGATDFEGERRLLPEAIELLKAAVVQRQASRLASEHLEQALRFATALRRFDHAAERQRTYVELLLITGEVDSFEPGYPLFPKGRLYAGRALHMIDPHRWAFASHAGRQLLEDLAARGHRSRFLDWYLAEEWSDDYADWQFEDYSGWRQGAPDWAAEVFEAYNRELDLAEWWIRQRQREDGSLGGGWGDDVEILRGFAAFAGASLDASPLLRDGIRKLADGAWSSGSVDTEAGYFAEVADTEHSGEWTADPLSAMMQADFGNPVYIERALKTAKLMRDLWMEVNARGWYLMRSNFLGATDVGSPPTASDSRINTRPAAPALAVLRYNSLPAIADLIVRWADSWLAASLSAERGKPPGVIPQEIAFADGTLGGVGSPTWYQAAHPPGTVNYDWGGIGSYHDAVVNLLLTAFRSTSDRKYMEPMELEAEFVRNNLPESVKASPHYGRPGRPHPDLWNGLPEGSDSWVAAKLSSWPASWERMQRVLLPGDGTAAPTLRTLGEAERMAAEENAYARQRWPHVTTEMIATDRVYYPGLGNAVRLSTGIGLVGTGPLVTYTGLGREFAAVVLAADARSLRVQLFSFHPEPRSAELVPWLLDVGPNYKVTSGLDSDVDGHPDQAPVTVLRQLVHRGQGFAVEVPSRTAVVVDIRYESGEPSQAHAADLALSRQDIEFVPEYRRVDVTVHNVGAAAARAFDVAVYRGGELVGRRTVPHLPAPSSLVPSTVRVGFPFSPTEDAGRFRAVLDEGGQVPEITERNNSAQAELATPSVPKRRHAHP